MLGAALATCVAVWAWTLANIVPFFLLLKKMNMLRSSEEQEEQGLDNAIHGGFAYDQDSKDDDEKGIAFVALAKAYVPETTSSLSDMNIRIPVCVKNNLVLLP